MAAVRAVDVACLLDLLRAKRNEIQTLKDNYLNGLKQLDYARVAIDAMKKELTELQPRLKETAIVVENLMVCGDSSARPRRPVSCLA